MMKVQAVFMKLVMGNVGTLYIAFLNIVDGVSFYF